MTKNVPETPIVNLLRPTSGGTRQGQRPERYRYWRVGRATGAPIGLDFWVARAGEYQGRAGYFYRANEWEQANWTQVYYFLDGNVSFKLSGEKQDVAPGDLLIMPAGTSIEGQSDAEIRFHWFALQGRWPQALGSSPKVRRLACGVEAVLQERFIDLRETLILQRPGYMLKSVGIFYAILARLAERGLLPSAPQAKSGEPYPDSVRNAVIFLQEHFTRPFDAGRTADAAGVSKSHLRALFMRWLGESPRAYHSRLRIDEATRLLREQQISVSEVAMKVGFSDRSHFSRLFKRRQGVPPSRYLAQVNE